MMVGQASPPRWQHPGHPPLQTDGLCGHPKYGPVASTTSPACVITVCSWLRRRTHTLRVPIKNRAVGRLTDDQQTAKLIHAHLRSRAERVNSLLRSLSRPCDG
jgi:hypothetical protein